MSDTKEPELESPPSDTPAHIKFAPKTNQLLVASWDSTLRLYDADSRQLKSTYNFRAPVLDCAFSADGSKGYGGSVDRSLKQFDLETEQVQTLGYHAGVVSRVSHAAFTNNILTGSWDHTLRQWDPRQPKALVSSHSLPERVYDMDTVSTSAMLVVGLAGRTTEIYDVRKLDEPIQKRESSLKYMTRAVACMYSGEGYATGSTEGRIAVEYYDPSSAIQAKKYAFKCHRQTVDGQDRVSPINALVFHPIQGTFASGGSDGVVSIWDHAAKKRLKQYPKFHSAVTSLSFNHDASKLAIAVGYLHQDGHGEEGGKNSIYIKNFADEGNKAKSK